MVNCFEFSQMYQGTDSLAGLVADNTSITQKVEV